MSIENCEKNRQRFLVCAYIKLKICVHACMSHAQYGRDDQGRLLYIIVRSEREEENGETETDKYPTTSCSSDLESSLGSEDYLQL